MEGASRSLESYRSAELAVDNISVFDPAVERAWASARTSGVDAILRNFVLAHALQGAIASGLAELLVRPEGLDLLAVEEHGLLRRQAGGLLRFLAVRGVTRQDERGRWYATESGNLLLQGLPAALIGYYAEAYEPVLSHLSAQTSGDEIYGQDHSRDGEALGRHCEVIFRSFGTQLVADLIGKRGAQRVLDLGCGTGGLILDLCQALPNLVGYGIDIASEAIDYARSRADTLALADRAQFSTHDAFVPAAWTAEMKESDYIVAAGAIHEHLRDGEDAVIGLLALYREQLVRTRGTMLLCEPELHITDDDAEFFLVHVFTAQGFPRPRERWLPLIRAAGLTCDRVYSHPSSGFKFAYYECTAR